MSVESNPPLSENEQPPLLVCFRERGFGDAFAVLWHHHRPRLGRFVRGRGLSRDRSEDMLQEIGLKLFRYQSRHVVETFPGVAFKITKDEIADFYRRLGRLPDMVHLDELMAMNLEPAAGLPDKRTEHWTVLQKHMHIAAGAGSGH